MVIIVCFFIGQCRFPENATSISRKTWTNNSHIHPFIAEILPHVLDCLVLSNSGVKSSAEDEKIASEFDVDEYN
jgi:hypothetical protein